MCDAIKDMGGQRPCILFKYCWLYITPLLCLVRSTPESFLVAPCREAGFIQSAAEAVAAGLFWRLQI
jgi:hypothetical protein